ncbi:MAG: adenylate/guanylate cyclase domain-containing protein [Chthonomonadales bacterium]
MPHYFDRLAVRLALLPVALAAVGGAALATHIYHSMVRDAELETHVRARTLLQTLENQRRASAASPDGGFHALDRLQSSGSPTPAGIPYTLRVVALNPANPAHKPTLYENGLIAAFQTQRALPRIQEVHTDARGDRYAVCAAPIIAGSQSCASCHARGIGNRGLRHAEGFGWRKGEVVGATIVSVPMEPAVSYAAYTCWGWIRVAVAITVLSLVLPFYLFHRSISLPLAKIVDALQSLRSGEWRARFDVKGPAEMRFLVEEVRDATAWLTEQIAREEKLRALFQQFVPAPVAARALGKEAGEVIAGARQTVTVLVLNIRNFALLMEHLPPDQTVATLNEFFTEVNKVIVAHGGIVSKYLGDSVLAFFGMPVRSQDHALQAIRAALAIPPALQNLYVRLDEEFGWQLGVGIGISTGEPIVGHFGSSEHMEYTVLGDVVKEAHALEKASKSVPEEDTVLISEATYRLVMSDVHVFDLGNRPGPDGKLMRAFAVQGFRSEARSALAA